MSNDYNVHTNMVYAYLRVATELINRPQMKSTTRKGELLHENTYYTFTLTNPYDCLAVCRPRFSMEYLQKEFSFYCSGSNKVEDAIKLSKFWEKCTDDGKTINSNYGKLLLYDKNAHGKTQFEHVVETLRNNKDSKKAVAVICSAEHGYMSNDNPCTMFLHFRIENNKLNARAHMRSNDIWFGTVYDVPFFCAALYAVWKEVNITYPEVKIGTYSHYACSIHCYERNFTELSRMLEEASSVRNTAEISRYNSYAELVQRLFDKVYRTATKKAKPSLGLAVAWETSKRSQCLKKKCGAALLDRKGSIIAVGYGGRQGKTCDVCNRDMGDNANKFYGDGCWSVHAEMRAIFEAKENMSHMNLSECTMYVTHGPCDACMKLMDYVGIRKVVYDIPYKTNYAHWPNIEVVREAYTPE